MRLTGRDRRLVRDLALSRLLSRDQLLALGYFASATRLNTRLRELRAAGYVRALETPFFGQYLYAPGRAAAGIVGERVEPLLKGGGPSPQFVRHALAVTDARVALLARGCADWRFEVQLWRRFAWAGRDWEVRPDGMVRRDGIPLLLEADMGHADPKKFAAKLLGYRAFAESGEAARWLGGGEITVLTLTAGPLRRSRLERLAPESSDVRFEFRTFEEFGVRVAGGWS